MRGMVAVGVAAETDDLRVDSRATRPRMFELFEHERARALADDQAVTIPVEGTRGLARRVIARAGGKQGVEHRRLARAEFFCAARHHERRAIEANGLVSVAD